MSVSRKQMGMAFIMSLALLFLSFGVVKAAPITQEAPVQMSLFMAIIIGVLYYFSMSPWFANLGFTVLYRPLVAGTLVGLIMGQPAAGIAIGANINILYLGWISAGGSLPGDPGLAGYLGTALALGAGLDIEAALALAAPLGLLGGLTWSLRMSLCSIIPHWADRFAEQANIKWVARSNWIFSQPFLFVLYAVPVMLAAYLGSQAVADALNWIGQNAIWVMSGLYAASGMLSALGIALNLKFLFRGNVCPYFFLGFIIATLMTNVNLVILAVVGACIAFMHVLFTEGFGRDEGAAAESALAREGPRLLTRGDVFQAWLRWLFLSHSTYNWERMQGMGFAHSMTPIIAKLYKSQEDISAALKRHLVFFNTQPDIGGVIHGIVIAMEEERAGGAEISDEAINGVKTGLMGPMAGIGDTIQQGIVIPIALAIGISLATGGAMSTTSGNIVGPIFYAVAVAAFVWGVGWLLWWQGYVQGRAAVTNILRSGTLQKIIVGAGVLGNFIMGALTVSFVSLSTALAFNIGGTTFELQKIFDSFMPNLLPLLLVLFIWWLLAKKNVSPTLIMVAVILIGIVFSYPIFPGIDPETGAMIWTGF
ncbi:MAG: PTS system mannose/fructose/sorbose family transporter subunit IID, partial [Chloroflexi bacterium]|nr:PTS system mannose/fructose/sorbose family transporter subunit IID [Chloroflexota bacterium]